MGPSVGAANRIDTSSRGDGTVGLDGRIVLITGATGPMGRQLVDVFSESSARLALTVRRQNAVDGLQRQFFLRAEPPLVVPCDLRYEEDVVRMVHRVVQRFGHIDVVINAAAILGPTLPLTDYPIDPWRNVLATNLTGAYLVCREVLPWMLRRKAGSIINVTSGLGGAARRDRGAYLVSNHGVDGLTQMLAAEVKDSGVRVNTVDVGRPIKDGRGRTRRRDWTDAFLWLADDASTEKNGQRILASSFARRAKTLKN
jgi:NAD(P)-dependent dehydrogenase (short-subunit alcohol dehydrogenase family)